MKSSHDIPARPQQRDTTPSYGIPVQPGSSDITVTVITATILLAILVFMAAL